MLAPVIVAAALGIVGQATKPTEHRLSVSDLCRALDARTFEANDRITARATFVVDMRHGNFIKPEGDCRRGIVFSFAPGSQAVTAWEKIERTMLSVDLRRKPKAVYLVLDDVAATLQGRALCSSDLAHGCEIQIDHLSEISMPTLDQKHTGCDARPLKPNVLVSHARARLDKVFGARTRRSYEPYSVTPDGDGWRVEGTFKGHGDVMGGAPIVTFSRCGEITGVLLGV